MRRDAAPRFGTIATVPFAIPCHLVPNAASANALVRIAACREAARGSCCHAARTGVAPTNLAPRHFLFLATAHRPFLFSIRVCVPSAATAAHPAARLAHTTHHCQRSRHNMFAASPPVDAHVLALDADAKQTPARAPEAACLLVSAISASSTRCCRKHP